MKRNSAVFIVVLSVILVIVIYFGVTPFIAPSIAPGIVKADADQDGLYNDEEISLGTDPQKADTDNDGISDGDEVQQGTSPVNFDTDSDGLGDGKEIELRTNPNDIDSDDDGIEDGYEVDSLHTDPLNADSDRDGLNDKDEQTRGTDPLKSDTDDDGCSDYNEIFIRFTNPLIPDVSFILNLKDTETNKLVKDVVVYLDGKEMGQTTQQGSIYLQVVSIGKHLISIAYPGYQTIEVGYVDVVKNSPDITLSVNMPNPVFYSSLSMRTWLNGFNEVGEAKITVANQGQIQSKSTMVLVIVYDTESNTVLDQDIVTIGSISAGQSLTKVSNILDTSYWHNEKTVAIIIDNSDYIPPVNLTTSVSSAGSIADNIASTAVNYLAQHPEVVGQIVAVFL